MSFGRDDKAFGSSIVDDKCSGSDPDITMTASEPKAGGTATVHRPLHVILYNLHHGESDSSILVGSAVMSFNGLCLAFCAENNSNLFGHYISMEFKVGDGVYV